VRAEHPTCRFPGRNRRAMRCECDHLVPYDGHNTAIDNLERSACDITTASTTPAGKSRAISAV
jgi:hypothetical protein